MQLKPSDTDVSMETQTHTPGSLSTKTETTMEPEVTSFADSLLSMKLDSGLRIPNLGFSTTVSVSA